MRKLLLIITLLPSALVFSAVGKTSDVETICGVSDIQSSRISPSKEHERVVTTIKAFESDGFETTICKHEDGVAVVGTYPSNNIKWAIIFN